jgi:hypothetical protein
VTGRASSPELGQASADIVRRNIEQNEIPHL